ncbi:MAG: acyltransferase [Aquabacterium sp.]
MNRHNNFDLLRLLAASGVMALHVRMLSASPSLDFLAVLGPRLSLSTFFVISGFLVYMSSERSGSLADYAGKRLRRVMPAYVVTVLACTLLGCLLSTLPPQAYFGADSARYLLANLSFLNFLKPDLPGVFVGNPYPGAPVNGALWTIKVELMFYVLVPWLVRLVKRFGHHRVLGACFLFGCAWWCGFMYLAAITGKAAFAELAKQMPGQLMYFMPGAWCYCERDRLKRMAWRLPLIGVALLLCASQWGRHSLVPDALLHPIGLAACVFWIAYGLPYVKVTRYGDLSYGIYIWHFPVIQTLVQLGLYSAAPMPALLATLCVVLALAWCSWRYIEAPMLGAHGVSRPVAVA